MILLPIFALLLSNNCIMLIANPIYDTAFRRLMENRHVARFFIETLIDEQVDDIALVPQEYTYRTIRKKKKPENPEIDTDKSEVFSVIRYDFVATIRTKRGEFKKVLIEIQKSSNPTDLMRFRTYLGEQYKRADVVDAKKGMVEKAIPIITIYLLGFTIPGIDAAVIKVARKYLNLFDQKEIGQKSEWIEALTHDGYFVQIPYIKGRPRTLLQKMLSVFEQEYFIDDKNIVKKYDHDVENENIREMVRILEYAAADPKDRRTMEEEYWAICNEEEYERMRVELAENQKTIEDNLKALKEKDALILAMQREIERLAGK